jgi:hypothetical protein
VKFRSLFLFLLFVFFNISILRADGDIDQQNFGSENINQPAEQAKNKPYGFASHFIYMSPAKISEGFYKGDVVHFVEAKVEASSVVYYDPAVTEGLIFSVSFEPTFLKWEQNPYFCQDHFYLLPMSITGFSHRVDDWIWRAQMTANFDTDEWNGNYTSYDFLLWGRYSLRKNIGFILF